MSFPCPCQNPNFVRRVRAGLLLGAGALLLVFVPRAWGLAPGLEAGLYLILLLAAWLLLGRASAAHRWALWFLALLFAPWLSLELALELYRQSSGGVLGPGQVLAILETNKDEALGYVGERPFLALALLPAVFVALSALGLRRAARVNAESRTGLLWGLGLLTLLLALASPVFMQRVMIGKMIENHDAHLAAYERTLTARHDQLAWINARPGAGGLAELTVIVIGESANRHHWHAYGYPRATTPGIDALDPQSLTLFSDVIASYPGTTISLKRALTFAPLTSGKDYYDEGVPTLPEALRAAGARVEWLSNQAQHGVWSSLVTTIASSADKVTFLTPDTREKREVELLDDKKALDHPPDSALIDAVLARLPVLQGPTVLFVHLMGSHEPYAKRFAPQAPAFNAEAEGWGTRFANGVATANVDAYDTTILQTDTVLTRLIAALASRPEASSLLYFSDHGEAPFEGAMHDPNRFAAGHVDVPLVLWLSPAYRAKFSAVAEQAQAHRAAPFMLDALPQTILSLVNVEGALADPAQSLLRAGFTPTEPRRTLEGRIAYEQLPETYCARTRRLTGVSLGGC